MLWSGEKVVKVYGIGPAWFWQTQQSPPPAVGQWVTVDGFTVDYNGVERNMASRLYLPGGVVILRAADGCLPLWRQGGPGR